MTLQALIDQLDDTAKLAQRTCEAFPNFEFECGSGSPDSPGAVAGDELLARLVMSPHHWDAKTNKPLPVAFHDALTIGCSVERLSLQDVADVHAKGKERERVAALLGKAHLYIGFAKCLCDALKKLTIGDQRIAAVADTAIRENIFHADVIGRFTVDKPHKQRVRFEIFRAFTQAPVEHKLS